MQVWDAAVVLARHLAAAGPPGWLRGRRVLELGAGCGLSGLVAWLQGAEVWLTEAADIVPITARNAAAARATVRAAGGHPAPDAGGGDPALVVCEYHWGEDLTSLDGGSFDMVIGSDIVYELQGDTPAQAEGKQPGLERVWRGGVHVRCRGPEPLGRCLIEPRVHEHVCVCVCVCARARARVRVCVCGLVVCVYLHTVVCLAVLRVRVRARGVCGPTRGVCHARGLWAHAQGLWATRGVYKPRAGSMSPRRTRVGPRRRSPLLPRVPSRRTHIHCCCCGGGGGDGCGGGGGGGGGRLSVAGEDAEAGCPGPGSPGGGRKGGRGGGGGEGG